jgi:putative ABC transport system permease protein
MRPKHWFYVVPLWLRSLLCWEKVEEELDEELRYHLEQKIQANLAKGMSAEEARHAALREFGGVEQSKEACRDKRKASFLRDMVQDIRYGLRMLRKAPGFASAAILTLGLGIGANTAIFSLADVIIRRPISLPQLDRLVSVSEYAPATEDSGISSGNFQDIQSECQNFADLAAYRGRSGVLTGRAEPEVLDGVAATVNFFSAIGVEPALGRSFLPEEGLLGQNHVLVLSNALWRRLGADASVLGTKISLDGDQYLVIGVMPPKFAFPLGKVAFWTPLAMGAAERASRTDLNLHTVGLLKPSASLEQSRSEIATVWDGLSKKYPRANAGRTMQVTSLRDQVVLDYNRQFALLLLGVAGFVLLIACANVANLQLARAAGRQREVAVRTAVGASRSRITRQFLVESFLLASLGGIPGIFLSQWCVHILRATLPAQVEEICDLNNLAVNSAAILFSLLMTLLAGMLSGIAPAWQQGLREPQTALKQGEGRVLGGRSHRLRSVFVVSEVALTLALLVGAGLMIRSFWSLAHADRSLDPDALLTLHINLPEVRYAEAAKAKAFSAEVLSKLQALPGVQSAAVVSGLPYSYYDDEVGVRVTGRTEVNPPELPTAMLEAASPDYFRTLRMTMKQGRGFDDRDDTETQSVAIVSESMANRFWPNQNPLGRTIRLEGTNSEEITVVGVVSDVRHEIFDRVFRSIMYRPARQAPGLSMDFVLRSSGAPRELVAGTRLALRAIDPNVAVENAEAMTQKIEEQTSGLRYVASLMAVFGAVALVLSMIGIYGVIAHLVNERTQEIGIRIVLGAKPGNVLGLVMKSGLRLLVSGVVIGIAFSMALARVISNLVYGVSAWDLRAFAGVTMLLTGVALAASYIPARRALRVDPAVALRCG